MKSDSRRRSSSPNRNLDNFNPQLKSAKFRILIGLSIIIAGGIAVYLIVRPRLTEITRIRIVEVIPNYTVVQIPKQQCQKVVTSKMVKNKNAGWWSTTFDSKNHPKYIKQISSKQVCDSINVESQVIRSYTVYYQFGQYLESMQVANPPPLNSIMPLTDLQNYQPKIVAHVAK